MNIKSKLERLEKSFKSKLEQYWNLIPPLVIIVYSGQIKDERIKEEKEKRCREISSELRVSIEEAKIILEEKVETIIVNFVKKKD